MPKSEYVRYVREAMNPRAWTGSALILTALSAAPFVALFNLVVSIQSPYAVTASYGILFTWGFVSFLLFSWSRQEPDVARKLMLPSGWFLRDSLMQLATGTFVVGIPILVLTVLLRPSFHPVAAADAISRLLLVWTVVAPIETWLQAWVWPIVLPLGPVSAIGVWIALHGARALDPSFVVVAAMLGSVFFLLTFLRYVPWRWARWFGPVASMSAHATWDSVLIWVAFSWPVV